MRPQLLFRKIHRWLGLILGIQILLWFASGFLMSFMPINEVRGDHLLKTVESKVVNLSNIDLGLINRQVNSPIESIEVKPWLGQTVVIANTAERSWLFETPSMELITPITEMHIKRILSSQLKEEHIITSLKRLTVVPNEARGRTAPLWQAQLADKENTRIYISEQDGEIVAKRTNRWRLFDFLWMLHIMDYDEREDFNHPLLYITALLAFLFTLTGLILLYYTLLKKKRHNN